MSSLELTILAFRRTGAPLPLRALPQHSLEMPTDAFVVGLRSPDKTNFTRPNDYWKEILQTLQTTVPSSTSVSQAIQALSPTPTPASKFLLALASSRCDPPPNSAAVAHASCSVLLRAMRVIPSAASAIMIILCVGLLAACLLHHVESPILADKALYQNHRPRHLPHNKCLHPLNNAATLSARNLLPSMKATMPSWHLLCML